jgi:riboflavin biosynthesis pyrimidine reductase
MRPHVICLMESSLDGRLHPSRWTRSSDGTPKDWSALYSSTHDALNADAWIVGRVTMAEMAKGKPHAPDSAPPQQRPHHFAEGHSKPFAIAVDAGGKLHFDRPEIGGDHVVVLLGDGVPDTHLAELAADGISYIVCGTHEIDFASAFATLRRELGIERLALEGGGGINGSLLAARLVDELIVIIGPALDGSANSRTIVESGDIGLKGRVRLSRAVGARRRSPELCGGTRHRVVSVRQRSRLAVQALVVR